MMKDATSREAAPHAFVRTVHGVRYQVKDVARSVAFYTQRLGFRAHDSPRVPTGARSCDLTQGSPRQLQQLGPQHAAAAGFVARMKPLMNVPSTCLASASTSSPSPARKVRASSML